METNEIEFSRWPQDRAQRYREKDYWLDKPLTRILTERCTLQPKAIAVICGNRHFSYEDLDRLSSNLASRLSLGGLGMGDTALVQLPNIAEFYVAFFALLKVGIAPLNALFSHRRYELGAFVEQIKPKLVIASRDNPVFHDNSFLEWLTMTGQVPEIILMHDANQDDLDLTQWMRDPNVTNVDYSPTQADHVAFFQLSGGSTGTPKLIPRTHNDYDYSVRASAEICGLTVTTKLLCALPVAHNFMLSSPGALGVLHAGGCVVLALSPEPLSCFSIIEQHAVTMAALVPSAVMVWLKNAPNHVEKLRSLMLLQVGGASFPASLARQVPSILGCQLQQVFGMAEGLVSYTRLDDPEEQIFTTQGRPISEDDEIKVVNDQGVLVPDGQPGILAVRGPYTVCGYYCSPKHNAEVFDAEGYYYSGDLVIRMPEGNLRVVGRVKDQINRGGEKIASEEVENLLVTHPHVIDAALVAMLDQNFGEKSCAFIVSDQSNLRPSSLRRYLVSLGLAEYKLPDHIQLIEAMPLTSVGKIDKKTLRQIVAVSRSI